MFIAAVQFILAFDLHFLLTLHSPLELQYKRTRGSPPPPPSRASVDLKNVEKSIPVSFTELLQLRVDRLRKQKIGDTSLVNVLLRYSGTYSILILFLVIAGREIKVRISYRSRGFNNTATFLLLVFSPPAPIEEESSLSEKA